MSQTAKVHKIQIRNKRPGEVQTGASTQLLLDGKPFRGVTFIKFEAKAKGVAKVLVELLADVEIDADLPVDVRVAKEKAMEHGLGRLDPVKIRTKPSSDPA